MNEERLPAELVRWEYDLFDMGDRMDFVMNALNRRGGEGWEAVGYTGRSILMKRRLIDGPGPISGGEDV